MCVLLLQGLCQLHGGGRTPHSAYISPQCSAWSTHWNTPSWTEARLLTILPSQMHRVSHIIQEKSRQSTQNRNHTALLSFFKWMLFSCSIKTENGWKLNNWHLKKRFSLSPARLPASCRSTCGMLTICLSQRRREGNSKWVCWNYSC